MRLINTQTLCLHFFMENAIPPYAILSHTWENDEVSFQEMSQPTLDPMTAQKQGYIKIKNCCATALKDGFEYAWADTCCIDKTSSSELSEAINSMYHWYEKADVCYAYIVDYASGTQRGVPGQSFKRSRWFTRGWTLQELIAPRDVVFFNVDWFEIGSKSSLRDLIEEVTGIHGTALLGMRMETYSVAQRMSWASKRQTTRSEDMAYCLMGLFQVNMPMLYGEGERAFIRLQEAIIARSTDHTLFAWENTLNPGIGLLAESPSCFMNSSNTIRAHNTRDLHFTVTNQGIQITLPIIKLPGTNERLAVLDCHYHGQRRSLIALRLKPHNVLYNIFYVDSQTRLTTTVISKKEMGTMTQIHIVALGFRQMPPIHEYQDLHIDTTALKNLYLQAVFPRAENASVIKFPVERPGLTIRAALVFHDYVGNGCVVILYRHGFWTGRLEIVIHEAALQTEYGNDRVLEDFQTEKIVWRRGPQDFGSDRQYWQHPEGRWLISVGMKKMLVDGERVLMLVVGDNITS